jgi:hypothetical protein
LIFLPQGNQPYFEVSGLPEGLLIDSKRGEVIGLAQEVGVFDLNISAFNIAGEGKANLQLIVNKTAPQVSSVSPRGVTSSSASMSAQVLSDGGEPIEMSLFWGSTDGGTNANIDPADSNLWDFRVNLSGTYSDGLVSHYIDGLDMNSTYYYRWMASNSVTDESWSESSEDGMLAWWDFNDNENSYSLDRSSSRKATFVGLSEADRVFGKKGNGLSFGGAGEHLIVKGFKGIVDDKARTVSAWLKTNDIEGSILSWGNNTGNGKLWDLSVVGGNLGIKVGGGSLVSSQSVNNNQWQHVAVVFPSSSEYLEDLVMYINGDLQAVTATGNPLISTGDNLDLMLGTNYAANHFSGVLDEIRLYERGLSSNEVKSLFLDGTMVFTTSSVAQPPVVEVSRVIPLPNASVSVVGKLIRKDITNPIVRIYYGLEDGGFDASDWNNTYVEVNNGNPVSLGEFNATVTGLVPGLRYYFRAFAQSVDGMDWSSGDPEVNQDLLGYWRMDEANGTTVIDSLSPFRNAELISLDMNQSRSKGYRNGGVSFDGANTSINLDANNTDFLEQSFDGRSVSLWLKPTVDFYSGPAVVKYDDLAGYYPFDEQAGISTRDLSINESQGIMTNGASLQSGQLGQALSLDGVNDQVTIAASGSMASLNQDSHTISMWVMPNVTNSAPYTEGRLNAHGFLRGIDNNYYTNIETMLALTPSGSNYLTDGPGGRGLDFDNNTDYRNAGIGINRNNTYLSLFNGTFFAPSSGAYRWEIRGNDDRGTIWLDLDQDGVFESDGDLGNEQLAYQPNCCGTKSATVNLVSGYYRIAIAHGQGGGGSNQEAYFSTPGGGPTSLTKLKPSDYPTLFLTDNQKTVMKRGPLNLVFNGNNELVYTHADRLGSVSVSTNQGLTSSNWVHLAIRADFNSSKLSLFMDGQKKDEVSISASQPLDIASSIGWTVGGEDVIWRDFFNGKIDDLRFYSSSLSDSEIQGIFDDDLGGANLAASKTQIIYDEGTEISGLTIALDEEGVVKARVAESNSFSTVLSEQSIRDNNWHHLTVTFGDSPKSFKLYLNGLLQNEPVVHSTGLISMHIEEPSLGSATGTSSFSGYGKFMGTLDELRIYGRGLDANEVASIYAGDFVNDGFLDFYAIEKPVVITQSPLDVTPSQATMRVEVQSIGGEIETVNLSSDTNFNKDTFSTLQAWFSGFELVDNFANGEEIDVWEDLSGSGKNFENVSGDPRVLLSGLKGKPVVNFDGNDLLWTTHNFDHLTNTGYTMVTLARYTGAKSNRVISSRTRNFLFGFHGTLTGRWYAEGWISTSGPYDTDWHLHVGVIEAKGGDPQAMFRRDGEILVSGARGSHNSAFAPGMLQLGGWSTNSELSAAEVAEVMIYDRELNELELSQLEGYLAHKWQINTDILPSTHPYYSINPFGGNTAQAQKVTIGGDKPVVKIFWGDDEIEDNSTLVDPNDDTKWDFVYEVNGSGPVGLGSFLAEVDSLEQDTQYFYRGYAVNLGGEQWAPNIETFLAMDTTFTKYTLDGMVLWLDAQDVDGDGYSDSYSDGVPLPLWIDKSLSEKNAQQSVAQKTPNFARNVFGGLPAIRFESGDAYNVGSLSVNYGNVHVFMVSKGSGVGIGATDGITGWSLDAKSGMRSVYSKAKVIPCSKSAWGLIRELDMEC